VFDKASLGDPMSQKRAPATYISRADDQAENKPVLVEWKPLDNEVNDTIRLEQLSRLDTLARLLHISSKPADLHVPHCIGYISDHWHPRIGFVFECATRSEASPLPPRSLYDLLSGPEIPYLG